MSRLKATAPPPASATPRNVVDVAGGGGRTGGEHQEERSRRMPAEHVRDRRPRDHCHGENPQRLRNSQHGEGGADDHRAQQGESCCQLHPDPVAVLVEASVERGERAEGRKHAQVQAPERPEHQQRRPDADRNPRRYAVVTAVRADPDDTCPCSFPPLKDRTSLDPEPAPSPDQSAQPPSTGISRLTVSSTSAPPMREDTCRNGMSSSRFAAETTATSPVPPMSVMPMPMATAVSA